MHRSYSVGLYNDLFVLKITFIYCKLIFFNYGKMSIETQSIPSCWERCLLETFKTLLTYFVHSILFLSEPKQGIKRMDKEISSSSVVSSTFPM